MNSADQHKFESVDECHSAVIEGEGEPQISQIDADESRQFATLNLCDL
jgi:hypothetical protein